MNINKFRKATVFVLVVAIVIIQASFTVFAIQSSFDNPETVQFDGKGGEFAAPMASNEDGDSYGRSDWDSLAAAQSYYGTGFTYSSLSTPITQNGNTYTHYYTFSNGTRMYFGVSS